MADVTSSEVGIDTFLEDMWEDMWGYVRGYVGIYTIDFEKTVINMAAMSSKLSAAIWIFSGCKSSQQAMRAMKLSRLANRSSLQKNGKPKQPNKNEGHQTHKMPTFLTLDIQKLTEKVFVPPKTYLKTPSQRGIWMYRVRLVRPDVVMLLQVTKVSPSSETVITWRQQWPKEEEENSRGLPNQTNGHNPSAIQPSQANPTKNYGLMDHNHRKQQQPCFKSKDSSK